MSLITENQFCSNHAACIVSDDEEQSPKTPKIVRRFINSAVYVEKVLPDMNSVTSKRYRDRVPRISKTVRCSCTSNFSKCPCHPNNDFIEFDTNFASSSETVMSTTSTELESQITVKENNLRNSEFKLSLTSINSFNNTGSFFNKSEKEEIINNWLEKKEKENKQKILKEQKLLEEKKRQREELLEKERENFRRWLADKKKEEILKKREKERQLDEERNKIDEKVKRQEENQQTFNLWLQRKKKHDLERKIQEKIRENDLLEERERRIEDNKMAFEAWIRNAKNKPKPLPLNQGLTSLCSSLSVTYINPVPWTPNINDMQ